MLRAQIRRLYVLLGIVICTGLVAPVALAQADQRTLVSAAALTFANLLGQPEMTWLRENLGRAKGVMIAPSIAKASLIVGGAGGHAVVVAREPKTGRWVGPAFYTLFTGSVGLQAGISSYEVVTLVMTDEGLHRLLSNSFQMGGDVAIAAGPTGAGARLDFVPDIVSFTRPQGVYVGLDLTGTIVTTADDWNQLYYGRPVHAADILVRMNVQNNHSKELLNLVATAAKK